jgi:TRAP transporter TAXI family solute receptor
MVRRRGLLTLGGIAAAGAGSGGTMAVLSQQHRVLAGAPAELRIATGPPGAVFREIGGALAGVLSRQLPRTHVRLIPTDASVDNLALLDRGEADLGFAALDAVVAGIAAGRPRDVTAVARLFDSWMQVLVPLDGPLRQLGDLDGRAVAGGAKGSGTRFTTDRLVAVAGLRPQLVTATQDEGAAALAAGQVAALFTFTGVPTPAVSRLAHQIRVRLLPLAPHAETLTTRFAPVYQQATLPSTTYPGVSGVETITTPNLLLVRPELPDDVVQAVATGLFAGRAGMVREHPEANQINLRAAVATMPVRLHPGAVRFFRTAKPYAALP